MEEITYLCSHSIWKIEPLNANQIVVELRDKNSFLTEWKLFNLDKQEAHSIFHQENSWWYSLTDVASPYLFFHKLKQGKNPEISELLIHNLETNITEHQLKDHSLEYIKSNEIYFRNQTNNQESMPLNLNKTSFDLSLPNLYSKQSDFFSSFEQIIEEYSESKPELQCEYLEHKGLLLIGYYLKKEVNFASFLLILSSDGKCILNECLHEQVEGITNGTFFALENKIIYVKEEKEIHVLSI